MSSPVLPFVLFAFIASITPGPSNILIFGCGKRHGFGGTMPAVLGASAGSAALVLLVGLGAGQWINGHPSIRRGLAWIGALWLSWLAWHLARDDGTMKVGNERRGIGAVGGAALQIVNPKVWGMALAVVGLFAGQDATATNYFMLSVIFLIIAIPCLSVWALVGAQAARSAVQPRHMHFLNVIFAILLLASAWSGLYQALIAPGT